MPVEYCPITWEPFGQDRIDLLNGVFNAWVAALNDLAAHLADGSPFRDHVLAGIFKEGDA